LFSGLDYVDNSGRAVHDPAVHLEGHAVLSCGELAGLAGGSERVLRHDGKALVLCAGDRDLPALRACLAALRLGHAVGFLPASDEILPAYQPEFVVPAPGPGAGLAGNTAAVIPARWASPGPSAPRPRWASGWRVCACCSADQR
jgi:hypothetical protein